MLLDSNILIYGAQGAHPALDAILDRTDLAAASVTQIETLGFHRLSIIERHWLEAAFERMHILRLDEAVTARAILLRQERKMGLADAIIAATALVHQLPLVTRNIGDFKQVAGLQIIDPFTSGTN
jgi:predicted nucleic acid-binding protein